MKAYFSIICKHIGFAALTCAMGLFYGCYPGWIVPQRVEIFEQKPFYQYKSRAQLMITPFDALEEVMQTAGLGAKAARIFEEELTKRHFFRSISVVPEEDWLDQLENRETKIMKFINQAQQDHADLVLYGAIENYVYGAKGTAMTVSMQLVSSATAETVWWGKSTVTGKPGASFLLFNSTTSPDAPDLERCLKRAAQRLTSQMFSGIESIEKPGFFRSLMQYLSRPNTDKLPNVGATKTEDHGNNTPAPAQMETKHTDTPPTPERVLPSEQVLDQAVERLESLEQQ